MIEAPEALYLCEQLNKTVKGKRITNVFTPVSYTHLTLPTILLV